MNSKSIVLTPSHLLPASSRCDDNKDAYVLQFASDVQIGIRFYVVTLHLRFSLSLIHTHVSYIYIYLHVGSCILTIDGIERVASSNISKNHAGVYTLVTAADDEYIIVNGAYTYTYLFRCLKCYSYISTLSSLCPT